MDTSPGRGVSDLGDRGCACTVPSVLTVQTTRIFARTHTIQGQFRALASPSTGFNLTTTNDLFGGSAHFGHLVRGPAVPGGTSRASRRKGVLANLTTMPLVWC
eukprot:6069521-Amphidinium_carterae.1